MNFEQWFRERTSRFEVFLIRAALFFLVLLLLSQLVQTIPRARELLCLVERREGRPYAPETAKTPALAPVPGGEHYLVLKINGGKVETLVEVLVDGRPVARFNPERAVRIPVRDGELVEIDGELPESEIEVEVSAVSKGIVWPERGRKVVFNGILTALGQVKADPRPQPE